MPRAFFFPSYLGSGFGHIGRCLALAGELSARDWEVAFALSGPHLTRVREAGYPVYEPRKPFRPRPETKEGPAFTIFSDMNFQLVRDGFYHPRVVRATVKEGLRFVSHFRPDVLVGDTWSLTGVIGRLAGLPVVQIIKSVAHPAQPNLIWWQQPPSALIPPDPRPVFNPMLRRWGLPEITRAEDLLTGDLLLVPSIPELDPLPPGLPDTHYVGALTVNDGASIQEPSWFADLDTSRPLLYVTIGGGAGPVGSRRFFALVADAFADTAWQVIVSTGTKFSPTDLPTPPSNVRFESWVPGLAVIARSDVVIFHGGYGTMMECVRCGVPSVVTPFHSEQESNGRRLEASGTGLVLLPSSQTPQAVPGRWAGGEFAILVQRSSELTALQLRQAAEEVWIHETYRQNANRLQDELAHYGGPAQAAELITALMNAGGYN
jgi:UDP:flavonoid glycosyltransferase YjiC (YdhE family)